MRKAMIYSENPKAAAVITDLLKAEGFEEVCCTDQFAFSGADPNVSLYIVNSGALFDAACRLAERLADSSGASVMLIADQDKPAERIAALRSCGIQTLEKPLSRQMFIQAMRDGESISGRICRMTALMEEMRRINRAKLLLMSARGMAEQEAHKYIEKQAMNRRITKLDVANEVIESLKK